MCFLLALVNCCPTWTASASEWYPGRLSVNDLSELVNDWMNE